MTQAIFISNLFLTIGVVLLGFGSFLFIKQRLRIAHALPAEGVVIELLQRRAQNREYLAVKTADGVKLKKKYLHRPVVRFKTQSGQTIKFSPSLALRPPPYQVGDPVKVLYHPDQPQQAQINRFVYLWFNVIMLLFFGFFMLGMGLLIAIIQ